MQPLQCSRGRGQAGITTDPPSAGAVGLFMPHPAARENGIPPFAGWVTQLGMRERATSCPQSRNLSHHQGWTPLGITLWMLLRITGLKFLVAFPKDTSLWTPHVSVPGEHHLPCPAPDPVGTSCRCLGQSKKPGNALTSAPLYQVCSCPPPAHQRLPEPQHL